MSNSENVQLTWKVTFPEMASISILYDGTSVPNNTNILGVNITAILTHYVAEEIIESVITLTVLGNVSMNETTVECSSEELGNVTLDVEVDSEGKSDI